MSSFYRNRSVSFDFDINNTDLFKVIPFRFLGHSYAIGFALRYNFSPRVIDNCSTITCAYIISHTIYRLFQRRHDIIHMSQLFDQLIFDGLASALIPSYLIYHTSQATNIAIRNISNVPPSMVTWGPTVAGLIALFFLYDKIDNYVGSLMDDTIRKFY